jgi:hypothetical protein
MKNDSIGFFGPVGWGEIDSDGAAVTVEPGPDLLAKRTVYFEHWAVDALADALGQDPSLLPWMKPRRLPVIRIESSEAYDQLGRKLPLSAEDASLLERCDGKRTLNDIEAADPSGRARSRLLELARRGALILRFEVPTEIDHPELELVRALEAIGDEPVRTAALTKIQGVLARKEELRVASGHPDSVAAAMKQLGEAFEAAAGKSATRLEGQTYAGRTIVYEDCRRDLKLSFGARVFEKLGPALSLVLTSARWMTHTIAEKARALLVPVYREAAAESARGAAIDLGRFWKSAAPLLAGEGKTSPFAKEVIGELQARWAEILRIPRDAKRVVRRAEDIARDAERTFAAKGPGWPLARYHSLDLQIAAKSAEAIGAGDYYVVLGELHAGVNGHLFPVFFRQHPHPESLIDLHMRGLDAPSISPVIGRDRYNRGDYFSPVRSDVHLLARDTPSWRDEEHVVEMADLLIEETGSSLTVRTRDGKRRWDIIAFIERFLIGAALNEFRMLTPSAHSPRVAIDDLVIAREAWSFQPDEILPQGTPKTLEAQLVALMEWRRRLGMPRFIFYRVPEERKPYYLDFASPTLVDVFVRTALRASRVSITEMLPAHGELWLPDRSGRRYTSELRLTAVDRRDWSA